jgi:hypothetical protein
VSRTNIIGNEYERTNERTIDSLLVSFVFLVCIENELTHRFHSSSVNHNINPSSSINPSLVIVSISIDDYFAILNCSTPNHVPHHKLDWYFQTRASLQPPRVIWQRGRSNIPRYLAYSPDQYRHYLQIKPLNYNDSGTYMCLDQTSGYAARMELIVRTYHHV